MGQQSGSCWESDRVSRSLVAGGVKGRGEGAGTGEVGSRGVYAPRTEWMSRLGEESEGIDEGEGGVGRSREAKSSPGDGGGGRNEVEGMGGIQKGLENSSLSSLSLSITGWMPIRRGAGLQSPLQLGHEECPTVNQVVMHVMWKKCAHGVQ